ncbi:MAG: class I SAM-dependent methyltransferase [Candidatus Adiutrix sp.]|nr:class I SAM-dependent methyltransferase [Candidatus Adiutrix sp.]
MAFYQQISDYYDALFPADAEEMAFVRGLLPSGATALDIGCGTGNKTVFLAEGAAWVEGVDLDAAMIARAVADNARPNIRYRTLHMDGLGKTFAGQRFDAIVCLGNTLVHLPSPEGIQAFLADMAGLLAASGCVIVQILNYDRILDRDALELPVLETPHIRFTRAYRRDGRLLRFLTALEDKTTGAVLRNDIPLYPLRMGELTAMLRGVGLGSHYFGSYQGDAHTADSFVTIAHCQRDTAVSPQGEHE